MVDMIGDVPSAADPGSLIRDFDWFNDSIVSNDCFVSHELSQAAKTVDFGSNGYTGSVGDWHFLHQITAPDPKCGVVYARGNFPDIADSILDRAQTESGGGSWGFKICEDSEIRLGNFGSQGLLNYRWPIFSYSITDPITEPITELSSTRVGRPLTIEPSTNAVDTERDEVGSLHICSFVKDGTVFQVVVIRRNQTKSEIRRKLKFQFGGAVRFGCACQVGSYTGRSGPSVGSQNEQLSPSPATVDNLTSTIQEQTSQSEDKSQYYLQSREDGKVYSARCKSKLYDHVRLDMQLFVNDKAVVMNENSNARGETYIDLSTIQESECGNGDQLVVVGTFSLSAIRSERHNFLKERPNSAEIEDYLGILSTSNAFTGKLWLSDQISRDPSDSGIETHTIARCVERIIGVSLVPNIGPDAIDLPPELPRDEDTSRHPSIPAGSDTATSTAAQNVLCEAKSSSLAELEAVAGSATSALNNTGPKNALILESRLSGGLGAMLIKNIMTQQYFDMENMFWQIRLLVKALNYHVLISKSTSEDNPAGGFNEDDLDQNLQDTREFYLHKIRSCIREALKWMITTPFAVENSSSVPIGFHFRRQSTRVGEAAYSVIALWYVWKNCANFLDEETLSLVLWFLENQWVSLQRVPGDKSEHKSTLQYGTPMTPQSKVLYALMKWCYVNCVYEICELLKVEQILSNTITKEILESIARKRDEWRDESEKAMKSFRKSPSDVKPLVDPTQLYSGADEELDRFVLLLAELQFESPKSKGLVAQFLELTRRKINERKRTTTVNSGPLEYHAKRIWKDADTSAPWEFECLNHHIQLSSFPYPTDELEIESVKKDCFRFLLSDYTFLASLDRSKVDMVEKWWDIKVSCIVCATLLDWRIRERNEKIATDKKDPPARTNSIEVNATPTYEPTTKATKNTELSSRDQIREDVGKDLQQFLRRQDVGTKTPFEWTDYELPGYAEEYFPSFVRQSLDDTPNMFTREQLGKVRLRGIEKYLKKKAIEVVHKAGGEEWLQSLEPVQFLFINIFDLSLNREDPDSQYLITSTKISRSIDYFNNFNAIGQEVQAEFNKLMERDDGEAAYCLWSFYLNGNMKDCQEYTKILQESQKPGETGQFYKQMSQNLQDLVTPSQLTATQKWYKDKLLYHLSDSYVDLDIRHRIFFAQRVSPNILKAFIYIWQPDGLDAFSDYIHGRYGFVDREESESSPWTTMITITHWELRPKGFPGELSTLFDENRLNGPIPPEMLLGAVRTAATSDGSHHLEERCSSIVITGDKMGTFWICSIISSLVKEKMEDSSDHQSMENYTDRVKEITQLFIHRKDIGRRLSFVILVGFLCSDLAKEYNKIIEYLESLMQFSKHVIFEGLEFEKSSKALLRLRLLIWGLESFRALDNVLSSSVTNVKDVKANLDSSTREDRDQWDPRLLYGYGKVIEEFDKRSEELFGALAKIQSKVEQTTRLRDGISSFTNVEQSLESLEQNKNIRILTFITIAYLPLGFIAALFSVQYKILPDSAGIGLFLGLVFGMLAFTIVLATFMGQVSDFFYNRWNGWMEFMTLVFECLFGQCFAWMQSFGGWLSSKLKKKLSNGQDAKVEIEQKRAKRATSSSMRAAASGSLTRVARVLMPGKETSPADIEHGAHEGNGTRQSTSRSDSRESKRALK